MVSIDTFFARGTAYASFQPAIVRGDRGCAARLQIKLPGNLPFLMKTKYLVVWKLYGADTLATGTTNLELARLNDPTVVAVLTADPDPFFLHIDQSEAIAAQLVKGLAGIFAPDQLGTFEERFAAELANVRASRANQTAKGLFLVVKGETNVTAPNFNMRSDTTTLAVCFDAVDKAEVRELFRLSIQLS